MKEDTLFTKCNSCGQDIPKASKSCIHCGAKPNKMTIVHWVGIIFIGLVIIGIVTSTEI